MKAVVALLVFLMSASAIARGAVEIDMARIDPMSGILLEDEFTKKLLPASGMGDIPALETILEERRKILAEEGETAMLLYQIGIVHFFLADRYLTLGLGEKGILYHTGEAMNALERAIELGLEDKYLAFAHGYRASTMGWRALHVGIIESLFMLVGLDRHVEIAMSLARKVYGPEAPLLSFMYFGRGKRFITIPWFIGGSSRRALEYFKRAIELDPGFIWNYKYVAMTYEKMGNKDKAIEYWQKVIELPLRERQWRWGVEAKEQAEEALKRLGG